MVIGDEFWSMTKKVNPEYCCLQVDLNDVENVTNPIEMEKLGLLPSNASDSSFKVTLQEVHIRAKLMDMAAEVNRTFNAVFKSELNLSLLYLKYGEACNEFARLFSASMQPLATQIFWKNVAAVVSLWQHCPSRLIRVLNLRPPAPETNA